MKQTIINDYRAEMRRIDRQSDTLYYAALRRWNNRKQQTKLKVES